MLKVTVQPFSEAATPMKVLSGIMSKYIHTSRQKKVTKKQLDAWVKARYSFLHNECSLMLKENDSIVLFMLVVMMVLMSLNVFLVYTQEKIAIAAVVGTGVTGFGGLVCINAAIACYKEQQHHRTELRRLKEVVIEDIALVKQIDAIIFNIEKQDYQTKLMFLPLNPAVLKGIIGYIVTGCAMIGGKVVAMANQG
jgi:hypothetical protein